MSTMGRPNKGSASFAEMPALLWPRRVSTLKRVGVDGHVGMVQIFTRMDDGEKFVGVQLAVEGVFAISLDRCKPVLKSGAVS